MEKIDFVVPWVDGSDPEWQKRKAAYSDKSANDDAMRYRDWGFFKYWFRAVETYAPWVNRVHLLTDGQLPEWIDAQCEKLNCVTHDQYIEAQYLPTFSANPIELNMHRIEGLSDCFVYFNDDIFLMNPTTSEDFFKNGLPLDMAVLYPGYVSGKNDFDHILLEDAKFFIRNYNLDEVMKKYHKKWYSLKYGKSLLKTMSMKMYPEFTGFMMHHQPNSFLKKTLEKAWEIEPELLSEVSSHKFRNKHDVNQYVFRYIQMGEGWFEPANLFKRGDLIRLGEKSLDYEQILLGYKKKILCLNDEADLVDYESEKQKLIEAMEKKFPNKSSFEK